MRRKGLPSRRTRWRGWDGRFDVGPGTGLDRKTISYNSRHNRIKLRGLNISFNYWWNVQSSENYHDGMLNSFPLFFEWAVGPTPVLECR